MPDADDSDLDDSGPPPFDWRVFLLLACFAAFLGWLLASLTGK